jgi:diguanylate cyclase (GGDEF)-like protein
MSTSKQDFRLPAPPQLVAKILQVSAEPTASAGELAKLVSRDPAFAAALIGMANSPIYNPGKPVSSTQRAMALLGVRGLRNFAVCWAARNCVDPKELGKFDIRRFWEDSLRRAVAAQLLAEHLKHPDPAEAFTCGLLQDLGVLALILNHPDQAEEWMLAVSATPNDRREVERKAFGLTHDDIASKLAQHWALPKELAEPMCNHHTAGAPLAEGQKPTLTMLSHWGEYLSAILSAENKKRTLEELRSKLQNEAAMSRDDVEKIAASLSERVEATARHIGVNVQAQPTFEEILVQANKSLVQINLDYEQLVAALEEAKAGLEKLMREKSLLYEQLNQKNLELERLSLTDQLTGLPNRRAWNERMEVEIRRAARTGSMTGLIIIDIDHFKQVNDRYGHDAGDEIIALVAKVMKSSIRETDQLARIGGEEFTLLLTDTAAEGAQHVANTLIQNIREHGRCIVSGGHEVRVTISAGLALIQGPKKGGYEVEEVISLFYKDADNALYAAKHGGRNRCEVAAGLTNWSAPELKQAS